MTDELHRMAWRGARQARLTLTGPHGLALLSGAMLAAYWYGGQGLMLIAGLALPAILAVASVASGQSLKGRRDPLTGLPLRPAAIAELDALLTRTPVNGRTTACFVVEIDGYADLRQSQDHGAVDEVIARVAERLQGVLRDSDIVARLDNGCFAAIPSGMRNNDLETAIQLAARMQAAVAEPISVDAVRVHVTASVGFALPRSLPQPTGSALLDAAECALLEAHHQGPGAIRAFSATARRPRIAASHLSAEVDEALTNGQIQAWFQPQVSTDSGEVAGFEALARWVHPKLGVIAPAEFLPAIAAAGKMDRLGALILGQALGALRDWRRQGFAVPTVAVNLGAEDLADPTLPERLRWELDRFELKPEGLCVEILETVLLPGENDVTLRNVARLAEMGIGIDLDDFGTGTASILAIKRFDVHRIKIDRSFITRIDLDRGQQDMVAAILALAERLGLQTLAEGVETPGEHAALAQLGCTTVQGFGIAAPMAFPDTLDWMRRAAATLAETTSVGRRVM